MPAHCQYVVPLCSNRKGSGKYGLFAGDDGKYKKRRLCAGEYLRSQHRKQGCGGESEVCRLLTFHRLPKDKNLCKLWLAAIPRTNIPLTSNSYICGQHFLGGKRKDKRDVPKVFCGKKVVKSRTSRVSLEGLTSTATPRPCSVKAACSKSPDSCMGMGGQSDREDDLAILPILPVMALRTLPKPLKSLLYRRWIVSQRSWHIEKKKWQNSKERNPRCKKLWRRLS